MIDWSNPLFKVSNHFTVKETLWLPQWKVMHIPSDEEKQNIISHAANMDKVRDFLGSPIIVHCWIRPVLNNPNSYQNGQDYNELVGGAKNSAHRMGMATDYHVVGLDCDTVRSMLEPKLEEFNLRMEKAPGTNWVHNDSAPVINSRYFIP